MYSYPPYSDRGETSSGEFENGQGFEQLQTHPPAHDLEGTDMMYDDAYIPQPYESQSFYFSYPHEYLQQLPFYYNTVVDTGCYPDQSPFDLSPVLPGPSPQEQFNPHYIGPQPYTEPQMQVDPTTAMPTAPLELADSMLSHFQSGPQHSPRATSSHISGPSTPSSSNISGVALYSHSPATPLNRTSQSPGFAGPSSVIGSRQSPSSPSQKRPLESSLTDDTSPSRRVISRQAGSSNVHSAAPYTAAPLITSRVPGRGPTIPQTLYTVGNTHIFQFSLNNGVVVNFDVSGETGISLHLLLGRQSFLLHGYDERISYMSGDTASIRIEWPGYPSFSKQIASKDWRKTRLPNTRGRLAMKVAGAINAFFQKHANTACDPPDSQWRIGTDGIRTQDLVLVSLHRVSQGSWQPKLCLAHENAQ